ncbi:hypothetical protein FQA39_LY05530 [Lamprigera yunnana]|nr:hypothetical protein FQA39_LY05530 [Lamprigera yunnana]
MLKIMLPNNEVGCNQSDLLLFCKCLDNTKLQSNSSFRGVFAELINRMPPRIHYVTSNGRVEVKKGTSVRLECKASGNPVPKVTWSRRNNLLPGGEQTQVAPQLSLERVDRHQAGVYQCTASNGVGEDVTQQIVLHVLLRECITLVFRVKHLEVREDKVPSWGAVNHSFADFNLERQ